ncbi:uncharacterized protein [Ptychodera flava]|uniref:uncharacterized protein n=1 Tax=Ptychodera flava TaxID=63121 RepID=UPI00396A361E
MSQLSWIFKYGGRAHRSESASSAGPSQGPERVARPGQLGWLFRSRYTPIHGHPSQEKSSKRGGARPGAGRPRIDDKFPDAVSTASNYVQENGFQAHRRRRETTGNCGVSRRQIREMLLQSDPAFRKNSVSISTIGRWMVAPHKGVNAASLYTGAIDARIPTATNNRRKEDVNAHYYFCQVKYIMEFCSKFKDSTTVISCDNMNKVKVGVPAVSRYHQQGRFYPNNDAPDFEDHDFPNPGYLITPAGYMVLTPQIDQPNFTTDDLGRRHIGFPKSGPIRVINRVESFRPVNVIAHITDISLLHHQSPSPIVTAVLDGGSDFNVNFITNMFYYARLWRNLSLDALILTSFCPGYSAYNMIERGWATLAKKLAGVILSDKMPGESQSPFAQRNTLNAEERRSKEAQVFNDAMTALNSYWNNVKHNGFPVLSTSEECDGEVYRLFTDYQRVHRLVQQAGAKEIRQTENQDIFEELQFMFRHIDKRIGTVILAKCKDDFCEHCTSHPIEATEAMELIQGDGIPAPIPSRTHEGHFATFLEAVEFPRPTAYNEHMPKYGELRLGCCQHCKSFTFTSVTEKSRHNRLYHPTR